MILVAAAAVAAATLPCPKDYPFGWRTSALELNGKHFTRLDPADLRREIVGKSISDPSTIPPWGYHFGTDGRYGESGDQSWEQGGRYRIGADGIWTTVDKVTYGIAFFHSNDGQFLMGHHRLGCLMVTKVIVKEPGV